MEERLQADGQAVFEVLHQRKDGSVFPVELSLRPAQVGGSRYVMAIARDITERKQADKLTNALYGISQAVFSAVSLNELFQRIHRLLSGIVQARNFFIALLTNDGAALCFPYNRDEKDTGDCPDIETDNPQSLSVEVLNTKRPLLLNEVQLQDRYATGRNKVWGTAPKCWLGVPLMIRDNAIGVMAVQDYHSGNAYSREDVTLFESAAGQIAGAIERKRAEETIIQARNDWENTFNAVTDAITVHDQDYSIVRANPAAATMLGLSSQWELPVKCFRNYHGTESPPPGCPGCECLRTGVACTVEFFEPHLNKHLEIRAMPKYENDGRVTGLIHVVRDITERKRVEEEKEKLQAQLSQAQKMESVGQLAGGVAHDFNNMLGVILGHAEMALMNMGPDQPHFGELQEIRTAAERSATLTRQLLAFARRQTIAPEVLDLNEIVEAMLKMLRRLIGEDIDLAWLPAAGVWPIKVDPSQIDQILANLCVNARDAIAGVGKVTIETGSVAFDEAYCAEHPGFVPGEYVLLAVSDNGCGMDKATLAHVFEPFFTTKSIGKGTGLGLATVYGIVKQNNGFINVYSEPGRGTSLRVYLPRYGAEVVPMRKESPTAPAARGDETILLVEDEPAILRMAAMILELQGYTVLAASTPGEAIRLATEHAGAIHLLMTDVVMPEMNGQDLAQNLLSCYPHLRRLFMSGYTANAIAHHGVLDEGVHFIQKPFSLKDLAAKVRAVLDKE